MKDFTVKKNSDGEFVVLDPWGFAVRQPGPENKVRSEQLPIVFRTEVAALAAAAKFQEAEETRIEQEGEAVRQNSRARLDRMGNESTRLRQAAEERTNLASATAKVRELTNEIVSCEHTIRTLETNVSALEGRLECGRIDLSTARQKLEALKETLANAKGEIK